ncbi:hypothetical protein NDU88_003445 [Pleurodeles waltl]|uniref:Uncharacterized protein n=1 Tax=Pleurodeles waltl TaxID=8319 RepID=A0AAV7UC30_PLEWA|nr:hypothetical protein NDU88_003445 [Pleurodeles waltl]
MSPGQPGKFAQACFVGRASGDKEHWKHGAAQGGEAAVLRVVRGSGRQKITKKSANSATLNNISHRASQAMLMRLRSNISSNNRGMPGDRRAHNIVSFLSLRGKETQSEKASQKIKPLKYSFSDCFFAKNTKRATCARSVCVFEDVVAIETGSVATVLLGV